VATLAVVVALATLLMATPIGLVMRSIFDDEDAAAAAGVPTRRVKIASVVLSAAVVGVAGGLLAKFRLFIAPDRFGILVSFEIALYSLIGGTHSVLGALVGAFAVTYLLELLASVDDIWWVPAAFDFLVTWRFVVYGVLVMVLMAVLPEGLVSRRMALRLTAPARAVVRRIMLRDEAARPVTTGETATGRGPLLEIDGVSHRFGGVQALDEVSFSVNAGEILALVGANGAGKSTLIDVVAGRHRCQRGSIRLGGEELSGMRPEARVRAGVARTFQSVRMFGHLTVEEVVRLGRRGAGRPPPGVNDVLALVDLVGRRENLPGTLTLAEQRRLEVGRAVASAPTLVMLDEPSVGMNLEEREELADLVRGIRDRGTTVLVVDHNLDLVLGVADRVVVLDFGRVLAVGTPDEVIADPRVRAAYIGPIVPSTGVGRAEVGP
jgi:branched-chain amino acid transport system permease protein